MTVVQRKQLDDDFYAHIAETKKERAQYAKDKVKVVQKLKSKMESALSS
jgi:hypothetical protein